LKKWGRNTNPAYCPIGWRSRFGIIIRGKSDQTDNLSRMRARLGQWQSLAANPTTVPQDIIIQSWQPLPTQYLPETALSTSTGMLLQAERMVQ
jgi:hypothetical protein